MPESAALPQPSGVGKAPTVFKRQNQFLLTLLIVLDLAVLLGSWNLAYWLRFEAINLPPAQSWGVDVDALTERAPALPEDLAAALRDLDGRAFSTQGLFLQALELRLPAVLLEPWQPTVQAALRATAITPPYRYYARVNAFLLLVAAFTFYVMGVYRASRYRTLSRELGALLRAALFVVIITMAASFLYRSFEYSRVHMVYFGVCALLLLTAERVLVRTLLRRLRARGWMLRRAVLVGDSQVALDFYRRWKRHPDLGLALEGLVTPGPTVDTEALRALPHLGTVADLSGILERQSVHQVITALNIEQQAHLRAVNAALAEHYVDHRIVPDLHSTLMLHSEVEDFDGLPVITVSQSPLEGWNQVFKRAFDLAGSLGALLVFSPLLLGLAAAVRMSSPGPVFYRQERMGWNGQTFHMLKFRTMRVDAEDETGPVWARQGDTRTTALGALLRKSSLDELPQFINVLRGEMSLVGPRPERPVFIEKFRKEVPNYMMRHKIKAGITGWAQVNGWRGDTSLEKRIEFDLFYIANWSIGFDLQILVLTLFKGFLHRNAY